MSPTSTVTGQRTPEHAGVRGPRLLRQPAGRGRGAPGPARAAAARRVDLFRRKRRFSMHRILIVSPRRRRLAEFAQSLAEQQDIQVALGGRRTAAIADVMKHPPSP